MESLMELVDEFEIYPTLPVDIINNILTKTKELKDHESYLEPKSFKVSMDMIMAYHRFIYATPIGDCIYEEAYTKCKKQRGNKCKIRGGDYFRFSGSSRNPTLGIWYRRGEPWKDCMKRSEYNKLKSELNETNINNFINYHDESVNPTLMTFEMRSIKLKNKIV